MQASEQKTLHLAFSGGGFRAAFYCLGGYRRLVELGLQSQVAHIASVSGGSLVAGAIFVALCAGDFRSVEDFDERVTKKVVQLGQMRLRRQLHWRGRFLPAWQTRAFEQLLNRTLFGDRTPVLQELPEDPVWSCSATCLNTKKRVVFQKSKLYANLIGESTETGKIKVSTAIAASAAFPLLFAPVKLRTAGLAFCNPYGWNHRVPEVLYLTDGGVYDNLGSGDLLNNRNHPAQPIHYLVFDASKEDNPWPSDARPTRRQLMVRTLDTSLEQIVMLRRSLLAVDKKRDGSQTLGCQLILSKPLSQALESVQRNLPCQKPLPRYPFEVEQVEQMEQAMGLLRTDLDGFHDVEIQWLMWAGAVRMDMAIKALYPERIAAERWVEVPPWPEQFAEEQALAILQKGQNRRVLWPLHRKLSLK